MKTSVIRKSLFCWLCLLYSAANAQNCNITISVVKGCAPQPVKFDVTTTDTGLITNYDWKFGDNSTSTQKDPTHVYSQRGSFNITFQCVLFSSQNLTIITLLKLFLLLFFFCSFE